MSANYRNPNWLLPNELNQSINPSLSESRKSLYSIDFNGTSDRIFLNGENDIDLGLNNTLSFWINGNSGYNGYVFGKSGTNQGVVHATTTHFYVYLSGNWWDNFNLVPAELPAGTWKHVAIVRTTNGSSSSVTVYVNGTAIQTQSKTASFFLTTTTKVNQIGAMGTSGGYNGGFEGKLDEISFWNKSLSDTEVAALSTAGAPANLMALSAKPFYYYPLGEFAGNSGELGGTPSGQTNSWKFPNQAIKDYVFDFVSSDYITMGNILTKDGSTAFSISGWIKYTGAGTMMIVSTQDASGIGYLLHTGNFAGVKLCWYPCIASGGNIQVRTSNAYNDGNWHNILATYDGSGNASGAKIYVDGTLDTNIITDTFTGTSSSTGPFQISARNGASFPFVGEVSNVAVWNSDQSTNRDNIYNNGSPQSIYTTTPEAWWKLNAATSSYNPSTSTWTITDSAGSNNGTSTTLPSTSLIPSDLQFESPYSNFSLDFDGTNWLDLTSSLTSLNVSTAFSVSCWFKISTNTNYDHIIAAPTGWNTWSSGFGLYCNGSGVRFWVDQWNDPSNQHVSSGSLNNDQWYHAVCTFNTTSGLKLYINAGTAITSAGTNFTGLSNNIYIASAGSNSGYAFNGSIDEVAIWNSELTASQVNQVYNNGRPGDLTSLSPMSWSRLGEDAFFVNNNITIPNQISGGPTGTGSGTQTAMLSADAPKSYGGGYGVGLAVTDKIGDAPESTANSLSYNMIPDNRHPYIPGYVPAQIDNAFSMSFDGSSSYYDIGNSISFNYNDPFTISCWVKVNEVSGYKTIYYKYDSSLGRGIIFDLYTASGSGINYLYFNIYSTNGGSIATRKRIMSNAGAIINHDIWYLLTVTYDGSGLGSGIKVYRNGISQTVNVTQDNLQSGDINNSSNAFIGATSTISGVFDGKIDEFAIFDYALTAKQVKEDIYNASTTGKTADLSNNSNLTAPIAWYRMGD